ncbi:large ribosomal subunit protein mL38 [Cylas formicarius]|uniref:large ribosomal subunit protein mL38 n=1 Tax=Cylas formicarius TaxID=197179 RepID=UPI0029587310|nr:large ribosomal subunit protein mL38 [Cylas formicarius]
MSSGYVFFKVVSSNINKLLFIVPSRCGHHMRGLPPGVAKSLKQKLEESRVKDESIHFRVDIGLPPPRVSLKAGLQLLRSRKHDPDLARQSRELKLIVDLEEVNREWLKTGGPKQIKEIADHFGVFQDLFGDAYFYPRVPLNVSYCKGDERVPVYYGNCLKPIDAAEKPKVSFESGDADLWTLILTNPDGHFTDNNKEYIHWFIGNIPGNNIEKGKTVVDYIQPFPPKGTGYHRHIFVLYKQNRKLDFSPFQRQGKCLTLAERTFSTYDFYRNLQDDLTPAALAFFQADWCPSLKEFFNNVLDMKEPIYEYDFPPPYIRKQEWFPLRQPFNLYMDKYRDPKQINKEFLVRKLEKVHPFKKTPPPLPYPNAQYFEGYIPSWLKLEIKKSRLKWGRINDIE